MGSRPRVVIVGGGFGGLYAARALRRAPIDLTVIDRRNHHLFQPLLYQVATAALNPSDIAAPIRRILRRQKNATVLLAEATAVDLESRSVELADGIAPYDYLILAPGAGHSYFGHDDWAPHAPGLKSLEDALEIRRRVLLAYEKAERDPDPESRKAWMTFVVVGGGPTGVELAGALAEISRHALARDFRHIDPKQSRIVLVEEIDRILPTFPQELSSKAQGQLERMGVEVMISSPVSSVDASGVSLPELRIEARTVLWAAGVAASPLAESLGVELDRAGRVPVEPDLSVRGCPEVFVIGDLAHFEQDGLLVPGVAQAAMQEARCAAQNILRSIAGRERLTFRYEDKGMLATLGRASAVADLGHLRVSGYTAWVLWLVVHIYFLIGFRNRLIVLFQWAWAYLTYERGARLITGDLGPLMVAPDDKRGT